MDKIQNVVLKAVGVTFANNDGTERQDVIKQLNKGDNIVLVREPNNSYDPNAVKVITEYGQAGYIGKDYAAIISSMIAEGRVFEVSVNDVGTYKNKYYLSILINEV